MTEIFIAFGAGLISFLSPCVLPLIPGYISYISGSTLENLLKSKNVNLLPIILFTLGFSFVFIIMGASIDFLSDIFFDYKRQLNFISGILIVILGLYFIGIIKIPFLDFERKFHLQGFQNNHFFPFIIGVAFAFGWSPCIGPILGSVLAVAIKDSVNGIILLSFYSIGLAVPFIIVGLMMSKILIMTSFLNKYIRYFQFITGIILLLTGILIFNGSIQSLGFQLNSILPSLEMLLI